MEHKADRLKKLTIFSFVTTDGWQALYVNGKLDSCDHYLELEQVVRKLHKAEQWDFEFLTAFESSPDNWGDTLAETKLDPGQESKWW